MKNVLETMKQALEALLSWTPTFKIAIDRRDDAITSLRAAIEQMEKQEPVAWMFVPLVKNPRVETAVFTTSKELALSWGYHGDKDLGHGTVTALGAIK